ncbi:T9SS type A sorting domain-containing protein [Olleya aquimaris]|uniref:Putative secreted protein (Por secretion system target) n=1 Tax=Olleya aquimaris TaxID=639310 RepID=A0A327RWZ1_9FLAO|nr:T9SS type A sorting domain-containing protein [Olleya aquimaris]RAJ18107.1 putative secreted protein (Por secretion system target) [Olleya aquimaris]
MKSKTTLKTILTICAIVLISFFAQAQKTDFDYKKAALKNNSNYYEIVAQKRAEFQSLRTNRTLTRNENKAYKHFERWASFWKDRVDANGAFPSAIEGWRNAGLLDFDSNANSRAAQDLNSTQTWINIGPQTNPSPNGYSNPPQLGRLNAFWRYVDAGNAANNVLLVGAPTGGIWKSTDNGATWSPKFDTYAGIGITDIKGSSSVVGTPGVLYASTGDWDNGETLNSIGVFKSTDMGETWTMTGLNYSLNNGKLTGHLVVYDANTVLVATTDGIQKTTDGGATWTEKFPGQTDRGFGRMASFGTNVVVCDSYDGLSYSTDSGETWANLIDPTGSGKIAITVDDTGVFYIQTGTGQLKQLNLTVSPATATDIGTIPADYNAQQGYNMVLIKKGNLFIEGSVNGNTSTDGGNTWYQSLNGYWDVGSPGEYMHSDHHQAGYLDAGLSFWNVNDGGLSFITMDGAGSITNPVIEYKSSGVIVTQSYTISIDPSSGTNDNFMMANQDNDGFSKEGGQWVSVAAGDGVCSAIDYSNPAIRYLGGTTGALTRSTEATGYTGNLNGVSLPKPNDAAFEWPLSLDTTDPTIAYGGFDDLYRSTTISTNDGSTTPWTENLNSGVGKVEHFDNQGPNLAVIGETGGLKYSTNSGASWTDINLPTGVTGVNSFSINAASPSTIYCTAKGYVDGNKVFKSTDGGVTWTNYSTGMPNILMKKVLFKQNQTGEYLFVATELGVYYRSPTVTSWTKLGANLPNVLVKDMKINYINNKMYIGTYGRGMWEINIENNTLGVDELTLNDNEIKIFPNPVINNELHVNLSSSIKQADYVIYNIVGGQIAKGIFNKLSNKVDLKNSASGVYIIKLNANGKTINKKFIIK